MDFAQLRDAVIAGDVEHVAGLASGLIEDGASVSQVMEQALMPAMDVVGQQFSDGEIYIPEMMVAARAMKKGLEVLRPLLVSGDAVDAGSVVLGTVRGDQHDVGKNIVGAVLEGAGFTVHDLGVDVPANVFVETVRERRPDILGLSCLVTTTMPAMRQAVQALVDGGVRDSVIVLVGGAPVTEDFARGIGADGYAADAGAAAAKARELVATAAQDRAEENA